MSYCLEYYRDWLASHGKFLREQFISYDPTNDPEEYKNGHYFVAYDFYMNGEPEIAYSFGEADKLYIYKTMYEECNKYLVTKDYDTAKNW